MKNVFQCMHNIYQIGTHCKTHTLIHMYIHTHTHTYLLNVATASFRIGNNNSCFASFVFFFKYKCWGGYTWYCAACDPRI